jgi:hypothetical protein
MRHSKRWGREGKVRKGRIGVQRGSVGLRRAETQAIELWLPNATNCRLSESHHQRSEKKQPTSDYSRAIPRATSHRLLKTLGEHQHNPNALNRAWALRSSELNRVFLHSHTMFPFTPPTGRDHTRNPIRTRPGTRHPPFILAPPLYLLPLREKKIPIRLYLFIFVFVFIATEEQ